MENENLMGFERKLVELLGDSEKVTQIIELFPKSIIMPLFYKGDVVKTINGDEITITKVGWKNGSYIYYFEDEDGEVFYTYEDELNY